MRKVRTEKPRTPRPVPMAMPAITLLPRKVEADCWAGSGTSIVVPVCVRIGIAIVGLATHGL
jgi:hypothetical protein